MEKKWDFDFDLTWLFVLNPANKMDGVKLSLIDEISLDMFVYIK